MKICDAQSLCNFLKLVAALLIGLAVALPAFPSTPAAEEGKTLTVCIPQHSAKDALLSQLANSLSQHKPDKNTHTRLKGVQLGSIDQILVTDNPFKGNQATQTLSPEMRDRAVQEQCDYILVVSLPDISTARSPQPNVANPNIQSGTNTTILICAGRIPRTMSG